MLNGCITSKCADDRHSKHEALGAAGCLRDSHIERSVKIHASPRETPTRFLQPSLLVAFIRDIGVVKGHPD